jgi:hypothetical protein
MATAYQLEFFEDKKSEIDFIKDDVKMVRESNEKVRKSMFARHGELARKYAELSERMQIIERNICTGGSTPMQFQS